MDLDLDIDLPGPQLDEIPRAAPGGFAAVAASAAAQSLKQQQDDDDLTKELETPRVFPDELSFTAPELPEAPPAPPAPAPAPVPVPVPEIKEPASDDLPFELDFLNEDDPAEAPTGRAPLREEAKEPSPIEFDLGELSLDLDLPPRSAAAPRTSPASQFTGRSDDGIAAAQSDPLATKLALAEEFNAIGDIDGARTLIEEVVAESSGALKARAQRMLSELE